MAGSSAWFEGAAVVYSNRLKTVLLGVREDTLVRYGAVSEPVVNEMVEGVLSRMGVDMAVAVSGIAGPGGGSEDKPVGTVCFAWGMVGAPVTTVTCLLSGDRDAVRCAAVELALQGVLDKITANDLQSSKHVK
jgi:nicotinamide-nucleotide amidase